MMTLEQALMIVTEQNNNRNYQKLYQYQFTFEYAGGKRFRTQG